MKLVLHSYWRSSASHRVRIGLGLKQLPYDYAAVNILQGDQLAEAYRAKNPMAQVPTLEITEDDGTRVALTQSLAILEYLEERRCELPDGGVPIGGADQRVLLRECGEAGYLGACAKQLRPADGFVDDGERVTVGSLGLAERFDRAVEEPHQAADVFRCRDIGPFLGVLAARERVPDQLVHHVERDIGKPDFQLDQKRRYCRAPPVRADDACVVYAAAATRAATMNVILVMVILHMLAEASKLAS